jgi:anti-sigma regulatory factor (Ser/Thr protein kinase)
MLPLAIFCRKLLHDGFEVLLQLPLDHKLARLFQNSNWAYLIDPRSHGQTEYDAGQHLPAYLYSTPEQQYQAVNNVVELVLKNLKISDRKQIQAVEWSVNEIADNVLNHSSSAVGGAIQVTVRADKGFIELVVADAGIGIPRTLREGHPKLTSDVEALDAAIREGVTRNSSTNMGNGLFGSFKLAELSKGRFGIYSGYASLSFNDAKGLHSKNEKIPYAGTVVACSINISNPELLSRALTFKGQPYIPMYSIIDRIDENEISTIRLCDEVVSFGSRPAAKPIRTKIENIISTTSAKIVIDLDDVALVTSSFADEVFGKLFVSLGPLTFMSRLSVVGGSKIVRQLIDRAISQRMVIGVMSEERTE